MACSADLEKAWARTVTLRVSSPRPSTFTRPCLWIRPLDRSEPGLTSSPSKASMVSRLTTPYSTRNGLVKPLSFGTRWVRGSWPPSKPTRTEPRAFWPLVPRPAVLPPLPAMPRPTRRFRVLEPGAGLRSWIFMSLLLDPDQVGDAGDHPADLRPVREGVGLADAAEAQR